MRLRYFFVLGLICQTLFGTEHVEEEGEWLGQSLEEPFQFPLALQSKEETYDMKHQGGLYLGYPRDYYASLTQNEKADIHYIITFLGNRSIFVIAANRSTIEAAGERIDRVHPLAFLREIFTNEELKVSIFNIRRNSWLWGDFSSGVKTSLDTEAALGNITEDQVKHLVDTIQETCLAQNAQAYLNPTHLYQLIVQRNWDEVFETMITHVPRIGNFNRYEN